MKRKLLSVLLVLVLALGLLPTTAFADGETHPNTITIAGTSIIAGTYYVPNGSGGLTSATGTPTSGFVYYDNDTGVLTLNNISISTSTAYGVLTSDSGALTINLTGSNSVAVTGDAGGIYISDTDCTITGAGSLTVTCAKMSALQVKSLTVDSSVTLDFTTNGLGDDKAILANNDISLKQATVTATATTSNDAAISSTFGNITIGDGADVTANGKAYAVDCSGGTFSMTGGELSSTIANYYAVWAKAISVTGGEVSINGTVACGFGVGNDNSTCSGIAIGGTANVTMNTSGTCIFAMDGDITVSGGTLKLTSTGSNCFYTDYNNGNGTGKIIITGGTTTASSASVALWGNSIEISGGTVAANGKSDQWSIYAGNANGLTIDGNAVVYGMYLGSSSGHTTPTKGVVYKGTTVSLDKDGKTVLSGGVGTVYGNPNVTAFTKPTGSKLGTKLDGADAQYITISTSNVPSGGSPEPEVQVTKTALNKTLVKGTDYTVDTNSVDLTTLGEKKAKIVAVDGSGNVGECEFVFEVVAATNNDDKNNDDANGGSNETTGGEHHRINRQPTTTTIDSAKTDTTKTDTVTSAKTFDAGIALYAVLGTMSLTGAAWLTGKKRSWPVGSAGVTGNLL